MSIQIEAERTETSLPLNLAISEGTTGLSVSVQIRDGQTLNSYLDFDDNTFKTAGHVAKTAVLSEVGSGVYALSGGLNLSSFSNLPPATNRLIIEFLVTGIITGTAVDVILLRTDVFDLAKALLIRALSTLEPLADERTLAGAIQKLVNRVRVNVNSLEIFETDGTTISFTQSLITDATADPITEASTD